MRRLQVGEHVTGHDGLKLGELERIVVDESGHRVTHLVVAGRAVEVERFRDAGPDGLAVDLDAGALAALPSADEGRFAAPSEHWRPPLGYRISNFLAIAGALVGQAPYEPPVDAHLPAALEPHEITAGSPVWSGDSRLGTVDRVITDDSGATTAFVLHRHGLLGHRVLLPADRVSEVVGNNVHVRVAAGELDQLEPYQP